jgi:hypothetical protein
MEIDPKLTIQALLTAAQVVVAVVVGWIAFHARQDAKRNSVAGLLKYVTDSREKIGDDYLAAFKAIRAPDFDHHPPAVKRFYIEMLESAYSGKRGLDLAQQKLFAEADAAWGLGNSLQRAMSGLNPEGDAEHNELFRELRARHLGSDA